MRPRPWPAAALLSLTVSFPGPAAPGPADVPEGIEIVREPTSVELPITVDKVWFRGEKKKGFGKLKAFQYMGDLTITHDTLDFVGKKESFSMPLDDLTMVSLGKMGNDVDTDWAVIGMREGQATSVYGFRDGRKLGYGQDTRIIYTYIRLAAKQRGAGQFRAPAGHKAYAHTDEQVALAIPEDWEPFVLSAVFVGATEAWGRTVFSPEPVERLQRKEGDDELERIWEGEVPAILFERSDAKGSNCKGLSARSVERIVEKLLDGPMFERGVTAMGPPQISETMVAECNGVRIEATGRGPDGAERRVDLRAFAHTGTLIEFAVFSRPENREQRTRTLERLLETLKLPLAER